MTNVLLKGTFFHYYWLDLYIYNVDTNVLCIINYFAQMQNYKGAIDTFKMWLWIGECVFKYAAKYLSWDKCILWWVTISEIFCSLLIFDDHLISVIHIYSISPNFTWFYNDCESSCSIWTLTFTFSSGFIQKRTEQNSEVLPIGQDKISEMVWLSNLFSSKFETFRFFWSAKICMIWNNLWSDN